MEGPQEGHAIILAFRFRDWKPGSRRCVVHFHIRYRMQKSRAKKINERRKIARWRTAGISVDVIAKKLHRHRSTIFRELRRNTFEDREMPDLNGYYCVMANDMARERRAKLRKLARFSHLRQSVIERIMHGWSPQQIAGRLQLERHPISVSHETIYKFAYSSDGHAIKLGRHLPAIVPDAGHDTPGAAMAGVSPRMSTFSTGQTSSPSANSSGFGNAISSSFARSSERPTWRRWSSVSVASPREVDPLSLSDRDLTEICNHLNATPRKCLSYKTPAEVFRQKLLAQIRRTG